MILFGNEPPVYREAMYRAFCQRSDEPAMLLPLHASIDEGLAHGVTVLVSSGPEPPARERSARVPVVNLTYRGEDEHATLYAGGDRREARRLDGIGDLVGMIEAAAYAAG